MDKRDVGYHSPSRLEMLKARVKRCVCRFCGERLALRRVIFSDYDEARIEVFCPACGRMEFGVEPEIYRSARYFVEELGFQYFPELDDNAQTRGMNIAKVCDIMAWENQTLGLLDGGGFRVPITVNTNLLGECLWLNDGDLQEDDIDLEALQEIRF